MRQSQKILQANDIYSYHRYLQLILTLIGILLFSFINSSAFANPFATPDNFDAASCPTGHKKYTIANTASTAPSLNSWIAGETSQTFTFEENSGNKAFTINFSSLIDANNSYGTVPFYGSINDASSNAINLVHNSTRVQTDHMLDISVNRPVSKIGYKIQDLDSTTTRFFRRTPYIEQVDVSADNGRLTFNDIFHNINPQRNIVTAKEGENCDTGQCTIDATWSYKAANSVVNLAHSNELRETRGSHATGYSDFYFCLAPPKVLVKKVLAGNRVNDSDTNRDQFELSINRGTTVVNAVTTTGSGSAVTNNNNRNAVSIAENTSYTITEKVINGANGTTLGEIANYNASYTCTNATTGSTTVMPTADMTYNAANKTRSFTLSNAAFGDEITCTITNTPIDNYTFTGYVFNDNGGIAENNSANLDTNTKYDISSTFTGNNNYFNGKFEREIEQGIYASGLQVRLTDCDGGTNIAGTTAKNVSDAPATLGQFKFTVPASALAGKSRVCLVQTEPSAWKDSGFSVDTTSNSREVTLVNGTLDYKTENDGSRNLDFGEVKANYASLVLIKSQHVNDCDINANYDGIFSTSEIDGIEPGRCIAYKIDAYNRGHVDIRDVQITDELKQTPVKSVFHLPYPKGSSSAIYDNTGSLPMGTTIVSKIFNLDKPTGTSATKATLYFNTKYGTTQSN
ncbi:hypothetical protein [uncultured Psychrobacter sp.]|uniref:hypothetical protein n=1 Tax=uncultured Psychrobacter sp. TaxID=259303 RepID=UPI002611039C|nr:hypothetical protein [uncultured Psychrobacter sp.]